MLLYIKPNKKKILRIQEYTNANNIKFKHLKKMLRDFAVKTL
jgi:hypothetical protein